MLVSLFALTQTTKTRAIKARVETHTLTSAYVIAQQARGLPGPATGIGRIPSTWATLALRASASTRTGKDTEHPGDAPGEWVQCLLSALDVRT